MGRIDETRTFQPVNIAILTVSDTRSEADDKSGRTLVELIQRDGHHLADRAIVKDEVAAITAKLKAWIADPKVEVVIATGGTGVTGRDVTPEAFESLFEKKIEGFGELFRWLSFQKIGTSTIQSRATGGVAGGTYLFALPGSPGACRDGWEDILRWQLDIRQRPCNLAELMPRLQEHLKKVVQGRRAGPGAQTGGCAAMTTGADYDAAFRTLKEIEVRIEGKIRDLGPAGEYLRFGAWRQYSVVFRSLSPNMSQNRPPFGRGPGFGEVEALLPEFGRAVSASVNAWNRLQPGEKRGRKRPL